MEMDIQNIKIDLIQWLTTIEDKLIIQKIAEIRKTQTKNDWWNEISDHERISIEKGISDGEKGKITKHSEVRKIYEKWL